MILANFDKIRIYKHYILDTSMKRIYIRKNTPFSRRHSATLLLSTAKRHVENNMNVAIIELRSRMDHYVTV